MPSKWKEMHFGASGWGAQTPPAWAPTHVPEQGFSTWVVAAVGATQFFAVGATSRIVGFLAASVASTH